MIKNIIIEVEHDVTFDTDRLFKEFPGDWAEFLRLSGCEVGQECLQCQEDFIDEALEEMGYQDILDLATVYDTNVTVDIRT